MPGLYYIHDVHPFQFGRDKQKTFLHCLSMSYTKCPICNSPAYVDPTAIDCLAVKCSRCGKFSITFQATELLAAAKSDSQIVGTISGYVLESNGLRIDSGQVDFLLGLRPIPIAEKANRLFKFIAKSHPKIGDAFNAPDFGMDQIQYSVQTGMHEGKPDDFFQLCNARLKWLSCASISDHLELTFILRRMLAEEQQLFAISKSDGNFSFTPKGWQYLSTLQLEHSKSSTAFVAMWFSDSVSHVYADAIHPAITSSGYTPFRMDQHHHNGKIDDEIIVQIKECKFLIADFTGGRGGVYFEASDSIQVTGNGTL